MRRGFVLISLLALGLSIGIAACSDGDERCGRGGRGHGHASAGPDGTEEDTTDFDATTRADVARTPAKPGVGDPDAADADADTDADDDAGDAAVD